MEVFAGRLKDLRESSGMSQKQLAKELGVAYSAICYWETSQRVPSFENVIKIAKFFNVSLNYLAGFED